MNDVSFHRNDRMICKIAHSSRALLIASGLLLVWLVLGAACAIDSAAALLPDAVDEGIEPVIDCIYLGRLALKVKPSQTWCWKQQLWRRTGCSTVPVGCIITQTFWTIKALKMETWMTWSMAQRLRNRRHQKRNWASSGITSARPCVYVHLSSCVCVCVCVCVCECYYLTFSCV